MIEFVLAAINDKVLVEIIRRIDWTYKDIQIQAKIFNQQRKLGHYSINKENFRDISIPFDIVKPKTIAYFARNDPKMKGLNYF